ncbi:cytochrome-c oxidase, cbb3-type subunit III [Sphingorhabdus arenilitoris]|uniref:Cbb3-type cytochrome c oxidase subunit n=1 Tax=Sphingorhabdus arenilitoris TaxID=1490041 RepID=A0ABV8RH94_9SPHN
MSDNMRVDEATGTDFVGHEWDGIEELDTPLPRWWLWTFYLTIIWGIVYVVLYPAWPMVSGATEGILGWSSRGQLQAELQAEEKRRAPIMASLSAIPIEALPANNELMQRAISGGAAAFKVHCVQCHGSGGAGSKGYPNLNDDDWLWGGNIADINYTLTHGIRNPDHEATRFSQMPAFGEILSGADIDAVTSHVLSLSGKSRGNAQGAEIFSQNCAVCHGPAGKGDRKQGAPNLTDGIWLFGGTESDIQMTIANSRQGVMPRWNDKLDPVTIKMLAAYVWSRGGGEQMPVLATRSPLTKESAEGDVAAQ